jgi:hypothetical protein
VLRVMLRAVFSHDELGGAKPAVELLTPRISATPIV